MTLSSICKKYQDSFENPYANEHMQSFTVTQTARNLQGKELGLLGGGPFQNSVNFGPGIWLRLQLLQNSLS